MDYLKELEGIGVKHRFIYKRLSVSQSYFSGFINGDKRLPEKKIKQLNFIINEYKKVLLCQIED